MDFGNFILRFLGSQTYVCLIIAFNCICLCFPKQILAEINTSNNNLTTPAMTLSLPNELKAFNKQLSILERMLDKKVKVNLSLKQDRRL